MSWFEKIAPSWMKSVPEASTAGKTGAQLNLARACMDMGDRAGARSVLERVLADGDPAHKQEAQRLMDSMR